MPVEIFPEACVTLIAHKDPSQHGCEQAPKANVFEVHEEVQKLLADGPERPLRAQATPLAKHVELPELEALAPCKASPSLEPTVASLPGPETALSQIVGADCKHAAEDEDSDAVEARAILEFPLTTKPMSLQKHQLP